MDKTLKRQQLVPSFSLNFGTRIRMETNRRNELEIKLSFSEMLRAFELSYLPHLRDESFNPPHFIMLSYFCCKCITYKL